jgi:hypothetical protein
MFPSVSPIDSAAILEEPHIDIQGCHQRNLRSVKSLTPILVVLSFLLLTQIPRRASAAPSACVPGAQVECACVGGLKSVQQCAPDGRRYLACECPTGGAMPAPVPVTAPATAPPFDPRARPAGHREPAARDLPREGSVCAQATAGIWPGVELVG